MRRCAPQARRFRSNAAMSASVTSFCTLRMSLMTFSIGVRVYSASTTSKWPEASPSHSCARPRRQAFDNAARDRLAELVGVAEDHALRADRRDERRMRADEIEGATADGVVEVAAQALDRDPIQAGIELREERGARCQISAGGGARGARKMQRADAAAAAKVESVAPARIRQSAQKAHRQMIERGKYRVIRLRERIAFGVFEPVRCDEEAVHLIDPHRAHEPDRRRIV